MGKQGYLQEDGAAPLQAFWLCAFHAQLFTLRHDDIHVVLGL